MSDTDAVCSPSVPTVYGQPLPSADDGNGSGELRLSDGSLLLVRWNRECIKGEEGSVEVELAQRVELTVEGFDGEVIPEASFVVVLEPTDETGSHVSYSLHLESEHFSARPRTFASTSTFFSQKADSSHSGDHHGGISAQDEPTTRPSLWDCGGFKCVFDDIADRIEKMKQEINEWRRPQEGSDEDSSPSPTTPSTEDDLAGEESPQEEVEDKQSHVMERPSEQQQRVKPVEESKTSPTPNVVLSSQTPFAMPSLVSRRDISLLFKARMG